MFMIIEIIEELLGWRTFIHRGYQIIWSKGQNNENINKNQCILKQRSADFRWKMVAPGKLNLKV